MPDSHPAPTPNKATSEDPHPLRAFVGGIIAGGLSWGSYQLLQSMVRHFPPIDDNAARLAQRISILLRYLLVGSTALFAFMFGAIALGLLAYGVQLSWGRMGFGNKTPVSESRDPNSSQEQA